MGDSLVYLLLFFSTLPHFCRSEEINHDRHSRLDTSPDLELSPVRPPRRTTTQNSITVHDSFRLPEPPYRPMEDFRDSEEYDYYSEYGHTMRYETLDPYIGSGTFHDHGHGEHSTEAVADYAEHVDPLDGHKDHFKNASTSLAFTWYSLVLSFILMKLVVHI